MRICTSLLRPNQWANLLYYREQIDNEVKALDSKSRPVHRAHIGDRYFVTMKDGWKYVYMFHYNTWSWRFICEFIGY